MTYTPPSRCVIAPPEKLAALAHSAVFCRLTFLLPGFFAFSGQLFCRLRVYQFLLSALAALDG